MVDDEALMLTMAETILTEYGYRVLTANSGQKAMAILSREDTKVDLIITDLVMPVMSGRELVERVRQIAAGDEDFVHERLCDAGGPADRHGVSAKTVHEPRTAGQGQTGAWRRAE